MNSIRSKKEVIREYRITSSRTWIRFCKDIPYYPRGYQGATKFKSKDYLYENTSEGVRFFSNRTNYREFPFRKTFKVYYPWAGYSKGYIIELRFPSVVNRLNLNFEGYGYFKLLKGMNRYKKELRGLEDLI